MLSNLNIAIFIIVSGGVLLALLLIVGCFAQIYEILEKIKNELTTVESAEEDEADWWKK